MVRSNFLKERSSTILKNVGAVSLYLRAPSPFDTAASCSRNIPMICSSVNLAPTREALQAVAMRVEHGAAPERS